MLLQKNVLNRQNWQTREDLRLAIVIWIEKTYRRRLTPIEYETMNQAVRTA